MAVLETGEQVEEAGFVVRGHPSPGLAKVTVVLPKVFVLALAAVAPPKLSLRQPVSPLQPQILQIAVRLQVSQQVIPLAAAATTKALLEQRPRPQAITHPSDVRDCRQKKENWTLFRQGSI